MENFTFHKKGFLLIFGILLSVSLFAQPTNDKCSGAIELPIGQDEASCEQISGDTRNTEDATIQTDAPSVCSGSWYTDDVWFSVNTGDIVPENGVTIKCTFTGTDTDVPSVGMATYRSCDVSELSLQCFSSDDPNANFIVIEGQCMEPNSTYLVRVWSGGDPVANAGTFRICAYETETPEPSTDVVIWSDDFNNGLGEWTTQGFSDPMHEWIWDANGTFPNAYEGVVNINSNTSSCTGAVGFPAGWYQTGMTGNPDDLPDGPPYPDLFSELVSPSINCSGAVAAAVKFNTAFRGLNGSTNSELGAQFSYSIDGGNTWSAYQDASADFEQNNGANNTELRFSMPGAGGQSDVRLRFTFEGDFYYWIIDDVRVIEPEANNLRVNPFYAVPNNAKIPSSQVEPIYFMADIENIGSKMQTNTSLNISITNDGTGETVYTDDLFYGDVVPDSTYENQPFENAWTPDPIVASYTGTYTISADSTDFDTRNNTQSFSFEITDTEFSKNFENTGSIRPGDGNWDDGVPRSWAMGCFYHIETNNYALGSISLGIANPEDLAGQNVEVWLYEWNDTNGDQVAQDTERTRKAFNIIAIDGTEEAPYYSEIQLVDFQSGDFTPVFLEAGKNYLAMMQFLSPNAETNLFLQVSDAIDYSAQVFLNSSEDNNGLGVGEPRFSSVLGIPQDGSFAIGIDYTMTTFNGGYTVPQIQMSIQDITNTNDLLTKEEFNLEIFPNPANHQITCTFDTDIELKGGFTQIVDVNGKVLQRTDIDKNSSLDNKLTFDISRFSNGTYYLSIFTDRGAVIEPFVIQK